MATLIANCTTVSDIIEDLKRERGSILRDAMGKHAHDSVSVFYTLPNEVIDNLSTFKVDLEKVHPLLRVDLIPILREEGFIPL